MRKPDSVFTSGIFATSLHVGRAFSFYIALQGLRPLCTVLTLIVTRQRLEKRKHLYRLQGLWPEVQGQNMALTVLIVPCSLGSGNQLDA